MFRDLDKAAAEGFRIIPATVAAANHGGIGGVAEKVPSEQKCQYKVLSPIRTSSLQKDLAAAALAEAASQTGWELAGMMLSYEGQILVLEKAQELTASQ